MAIFVYVTATGELFSWSPNDTDPALPADVLAAQGYTIVSGLPALDAAHAWSASTKTVIGVTPPAAAQPILTAMWILRFTAAEFQAVSQSTDATVQQFMYALNHTTQVDLSTPQMIGGAEYLVSINLITSARLPIIMAVPSSINGP